MSEPPPLKAFSNRAVAHRKFAELSDKYDDLRAKAKMDWAQKMPAAGWESMLTPEDKAEMARLDAEMDKLMPALEM